jgi:hypothetical protein
LSAVFGTQLFVANWIDPALPAIVSMGSPDDAEMRNASMVSPMKVGITVNRVSAKRTLRLEVDPVEAGVPAERAQLEVHHFLASVNCTAWRS